MSDFGDFDPDDAWAEEPPDAEQVAKKIHQYRRENGRETVDWDSLDLAERTLLIGVIVRLLAWLRRQGALR